MLQNKITCMPNVRTYEKTDGQTDTDKQAGKQTHPDGQTDRQSPNHCAEKTCALLSCSTFRLTLAFTFPLYKYVKSHCKKHVKNN